MIRDDGSVVHFNNPKVQASLAANTFAITGHGEIKRKSCHCVLGVIGVGIFCLFLFCMFVS